MTVCTPSLKQRLASGDVTIGAWSTIPAPVAAEAMASCGFDWLAVDMEHGGAAVNDLEALFLAAERHHVAPLVRLTSADPYLARRALDLGAAGLIIPVVEDVNRFSDFLQHCLYPSQGGKRGVGLSRANCWGDHFETYLSDFRPVIVPQIETCTGVANARAIAALDQVDALFLGPYDLSASLGDSGNFATPAFIDAISEVRATCSATGKAAGIHQVKPDLAELQLRLDEGFRFIAYGTDALAIRHALAGISTLTGNQK